MGNAAAVKAIVWKEMRENAKWASVIGLALLLVFLVSLLNAQGPVSRNLNNQGNVYESFWMTVWMSFAFVGMLAGLCLSLLQILPELRRDQWAFLVHRPTTVGTLFAGKVAAGLVLYTAAMLTPLLALGLWLGTPGMVAFPFEWFQFSAFVVPFLCGIAVYFGGLIAGIWQPQWVGGKLFVLIGIVVIAVVAVATSFHFLWDSVAGSLCALLITGVAAIATFRRNSELPSNCARGRFFLGVNIYIGIFALLVVLVGVSSYRTLRGSLRNVDFDSAMPYFVDEQGLVMDVNTALYVSRLGARDLNGRVIPELGTLHSSRRVEAPSDYVTIKKSRYLRFDPDRIVECIARFGSFNGNAALLYYNSVRRLFLVYDLGTRQLTGSLGEDGFIPIGDPTRSIDANRLPEAASSVSANIGQGSIDIVMPHMLLALDNVTGSTLFKYFEPMRTSPFIGFGRLFSFPATRPGTSYYAYSSRGIEIIKDGVHFATIAQSPDDHSSLKDGQFYYLQTGNIVAIVCQSIPRSSYSHNAPVYTEYDITPSGRVADYHSLPVIPSQFPQGRHSVLYINSPIIAVVLPPIYWMAALLQNSAGSYDTSPLSLIAIAGPGIQTFFVAATIYALLGWLYAKRAGLATGGAVAWTIFCLLLGVSGLLLLISLHSLPAREVCPSCGKRRLVTNALCEYCGTAWPARALQPTDIFAASTPRGMKQDADASYDLNFETGR